MKRKIYIECDGGFGNRFNEVITGLYVARLFNLEPIIVWLETNRCMARFEDIFDNNIAELTVIGEGDFSKIKTTKTLQPMYHGYDYLVNEVHFKPTPFNLLLKNDLNDVYSLLKESDYDLHFSINLIPKYLDLGVIDSILDQLVFKKSILDKVSNVLSTISNNRFYGLHMRMTDFCTTDEQKQSWINLIKTSTDKLFFVCSDSEDFEKEISVFDNVFLFDKNSYVEKLTDGDWRHEFTDNDGRLMRFNVNRSAESVIDAMVDMLILSESEIIQTSHSTFLKTALLLRAKKRGLLKFGETYGKYFY